jgi:hypothetical protein
MIIKIKADKLRLLMKTKIEIKYKYSKRKIK